MAAAVSAKLVKELRDKTGAGMMDCKKALAATEGDADKAVEWLRQKGIASAEKKSGRTAAEGAIGSYIHTGARVGVLVEVNCETDFVARGDMFQSLLRDVSMQVAACPNVEYVTTDEIPDEIREREKAIEMGRFCGLGAREFLVIECDGAIGVFDRDQRLVKATLGNGLRGARLTDQREVIYRVAIDTLKGGNSIGTDTLL